MSVMVGDLLTEYHVSPVSWAHYVCRCDQHCAAASTHVGPLTRLTILNARSCRFWPEDYVEVEWTVGPIPIDDGLGEHIHFQSVLLTAIRLFPVRRRCVHVEDTSLTFGNQRQVATRLAGKEVVIRYSSDVRSGDEVYTDANGREMLRRVRDRRPTWDLNVTEPTAGNFYPVRTLARTNAWPFAFVSVRALI